VVVPLVLLTAVASVVIGGSISPDYEASTKLLLVGPGIAAPVDPAAPADPAAPTTTAAPTAADGSPNPLLTLSSALNSIARASLEALDDDSVARSLEEAGLSTDYEIVVAEKDPIMEITVTDTSADGALETLSALNATLTADLENRQDEAGAPQQSRIQVQTLSETNAPQALYENRRRAQLVIVALGLVIATVAAFGVEGMTERRRTAGAGGSHLGGRTVPAAGDDDDDVDDDDVDGPSGPRLPFARRGGGDDVTEQLESPNGGHHVTAGNGNGNGHDYDDDRRSSWSPERSASTDDDHDGDILSNGERSSSSERWG
jgi:hypothetical protein